MEKLAVGYRLVVAGQWEQPAGWEEKYAEDAGHSWSVRTAEMSTTRPPHVVKNQLAGTRK